jgi:hypothetical protein
MEKLKENINLVVEYELLIERGRISVFFAGLLNIF